MELNTIPMETILEDKEIRDFLSEKYKDRLEAREMAFVAVRKIRDEIDLEVIVYDVFTTAKNLQLFSTDDFIRASFFNSDNRHIQIIFDRVNKTIKCVGLRANLMTLITDYYARRVKESN